MTFHIPKDKMAEFGLNLARSGMDIAFGMTMDKFEKEKQEAIDSIRSRTFQKKRQAIEQRQQSQSNETVEAQDSEVSDDDIEGANQRHREEWEKMFNRIATLPDDASPGKVKRAMRDNYKHIRNYWCRGCAKNAITRHLPNLQRRGKSFFNVNTKRDAIMRMCEFKNEVNRDLGKQIYPCAELAT